jgi:hypothetical protein
LLLPGRLGDAEEMIVRIESSALHRVERGDGLHQRLAGAPGFRHCDKAAGLQRQALQQPAVAIGIEIVHEMDARRVAQGADPRHRMAGKLR